MARGEATNMGRDQITKCYTKMFKVMSLNSLDFILSDGEPLRGLSQEGDGMRLAVQITQMSGER